MFKPDVEKNGTQKKMGNLLHARSKLSVEKNERGKRRMEQPSQRLLELALDRVFDTKSARASNKTLNKDLIISTIPDAKTNNIKMNGIHSNNRIIADQLKEVPHHLDEPNTQMEILKIPSLYYAIKKTNIANEDYKNILNTSKHKYSRNFQEHYDPIHKINLSVPAIEDKCKVLLPLISKRRGLIPTLPIKRIRKPMLANKLQGYTNKKPFSILLVPELRKERSFRLDIKTLFAKRQESILKLRELKETKGTSNRCWIKRHSLV